VKFGKFKYEGKFGCIQQVFDEEKEDFKEFMKNEILNAQRKIERFIEANNS